MKFAEKIVRLQRSFFANGRKIFDFHIFWGVQLCIIMALNPALNGAQIYQ
jgi:hypothetical protein